MKFNINYKPYEDELLLTMLDEPEMGVTLARASVLLLNIVASLESIVKLIPRDDSGNPKSIIFAAGGPPEYIMELNEAIDAVANKWSEELETIDDEETT